MHLRRIALCLIPLALSACAASTPAEDNQNVAVDAPLDTEILQMAMPGKQVEVPNHGAEKFLAVGPMEGVNDTPANGVVDMHVFADGATIGSVQLNINVPEDGSFFEAWLAKADGRPAISLGHLTNPFNDVRHSLRYEQKDDLRAYTQVVVTLEEDNGDPGASTSIVAKGTLKPQKRG